MLEEFCVNYVNKNNLFYYFGNTKKYIKTKKRDLWGREK
jgi:hypothetical protein